MGVSTAICRRSSIGCLTYMGHRGEGPCLSGCGRLMATTSTTTLRGTKPISSPSGQAT